jgi:hypothetical protein
VLKNKERRKSMRKKSILFSVISAAIVICLFTPSIAQAAPLINVEKSVSTNSDGSGAEPSDTQEGQPVFNEGQEIYYVYEWSIEYDPEDTVNYNWEVTDSSGELIGSGIITPTDLPVTGKAVYERAADEGQHSSFVTLSVNPVEGDEVIEPVTNDLYYYGIPAAEEIVIDIKPGSDPNSINLRSQGVVPVALIDFDPSILEGATLTFAGAVALRWAVEDVDGDGDPDVICHFRTQELELKGDSTTAGVEIGTYDEIAEQEVTSYAGEDTVNIVPKGKAKGHAKGNTSSASNKGNNGNKGGNGKNKNK